MTGVWEVALGLAVVLVAIVAVAWLMRRLNLGAVTGGASLRVLAALPLGPRERILLIDAAGTHLLLGVTAQQITTLHAFPEPVVISGQAGSSEFALRLREVLGRGGKQ